VSDPAEWLRGLAANLRTEPDLPPGVIVLEAVAESGTERIARTASHPGGIATSELMEDVRSFAESTPYCIRLSERGEPLWCECCGTLVALTPETADGAALLGTGARWKPAIWEYETLRKHTMRRCDAMQANR
jgi:hypothetical protein